MGLNWAVQSDYPEMNKHVHARETSRICVWPHRKEFIGCRSGSGRGGTDAGGVLGPGCGQSGAPGVHFLPPFSTTLPLVTSGTSCVVSCFHKNLSLTFSKIKTSVSSRKASSVSSSLIEMAGVWIWTKGRLVRWTWLVLIDAPLLANCRPWLTSHGIFCLCPAA